MRIRLDIAYDGTGLHGWAKQPDRDTVQGHLETALSKLYGRAIRTAGASRTDAGVHALQQVAHFETRDDDPPIPPQRLRAAVQPWLPPQIAVLATSVAPDGWHAIASVVGKRYRYLIHNARTPQPALRDRCWRVQTPLDLEAMQRAATHLVGRHDFAAFESSGAPRDSTVRTVHELTVRQVPIWGPLQPPAVADFDPGRLIAIEIEGDGFLYNMVRAIAGTLVPIGAGKWTPDRLLAIRESVDRSQAGETAPAAGLTLVRIDYD